MLYALYNNLSPDRPCHSYVHLNSMGSIQYESFYKALDISILTISCSAFSQVLVLHLSGVGKMCKEPFPETQHQTRVARNGTRHLSVVSPTA